MSGKNISVFSFDVLHAHIRKTIFCFTDVRMCVCVCEYVCDTNYFFANLFVSYIVNSFFLERERVRIGE